MLETVTVIHRNDQELADFVFVLTFEYCQEAAQWVGLCQELGTSAFADTLEQARLELGDAVELQLNEIEKLTNVQEYLTENHVRIAAIEAASSPPAAGLSLIHI